MDRPNVRNLKELEIRKQSQVTISKSFAALENLNGSDDINRTRKTLKRISEYQMNRVSVCTN